MKNRFSRDNGPTDELGRDVALGEALESFDPASWDPNYWFRFHGRVMTDVGPELARRRMMADLTIVDVMASWSRTVVPTAFLAAALAVLMLTRAAGPLEQPVGVEEFLVTDIPSEAVPAMISADAPAVLAAFASDVY